MANHRKKRSAKAGQPPGSLIHIGERRVDRSVFSIFDYNGDHYTEICVGNVAQCRHYMDTPETTWINIDGIHEPAIFEDFEKHFNLHPLVLEDILNTDHRPKMEDYDKYIHVVLKMMSYKNGDIDAEQISLIIAPTYVISFQEYPGDLFDAIRDRIRQGKGRLRGQGTDYLAYSLIDIVVDNYFAIIEQIGERIEVLEDSIIAQPSTDTVREVHHLKGMLIRLRKAVWPLREMLDGLRKSENLIIKPETVRFLTDIYDHTIHIIDTIETYRDMLAGMLDIYLSSVSNRMNEVMKVLTIISTIFIPLTFLAGIYGMNFEYFPELHWRWAYPALWLLMVTLVIMMLAIFRRKKWL